MIPNEVKNVFQEIITNEMFEMNRQLAATMDATQASLIARGHSGSGAMVRMLAQDATNSLKARGQIILSQLVRCCGAYSVVWDDPTLRDASVMLRDGIEAESQVIRSRLLSFPIFAQQLLPNARQQVEIEYGQEGPRLTNRLISELQLVAAAARARSDQIAGGNVTIHGPVGVVQTGAASQASVVQHIDAGTKTQLILGLQSCLDELSKPENHGILNKDQLRDLIVDTKSELEKPEPNTLKVGAGLRTIAETTKFIGSLGPAYQVIRPFLGFFGIHLP
jgi:hypothetical protein